MKKSGVRIPRFVAKPPSGTGRIQKNPGERCEVQGTGRNVQQDSLHRKTNNRDSLSTTSYWLLDSLIGDVRCGMICIGFMLRAWDLGFTGFDSLRENPQRLDPLEI